LLKGDFLFAEVGLGGKGFGHGVIGFGLCKKVNRETRRRGSESLQGPVDEKDAPKTFESLKSHAPIALKS
jgi:hypothetical protein